MTAGAGGSFGEVKVKGISLNTFHLSPESAVKAIETVQQETGLFCSDVVRFGGQRLLSEQPLSKTSPFKEPKVFVAGHKSP